MTVFHVGKIPVRLHPGIWAVLVINLVVAITASRYSTASLAGWAATWLVVVTTYPLVLVAHEAGHLTAALACRGEVAYVRFSAFVGAVGAVIPTRRRQALYYGAGPLAHLAVAGAYIALARAWPGRLPVAVANAVAVAILLNMLFLAINLVPIRAFGHRSDGAQLLALWRHRQPPESALA